MLPGRSRRCYVRGCSSPRLLDKLKKDRLHPPADRMRLVRAVEALELIGTQEARRVLRNLARGAPEAQLTLEAKTALERLTQAPASKP